MDAPRDSVPRRFAPAALGSLWARFSRSITVVELALVLVLSLVYVGIHATQIEHVFGEADGVRMATDATAWHFNGRVHLETTDYRMRTSPLYIQTLKTALDLGLRIRSLPRFMSWLSLLSSLVGLTATYFLFRPLVGKVGAAIAALFLMLMPAYWLSGAYGMSHGPGVTALLLALCTFCIALHGERTTKQFAGISALAAFLVFIALSLKADLVLNGLAFPGLAFALRRLDRRNFVAACAVVVVGLVLQMIYIRVVVTPLPVSQSALQFASAFNDRFPFEWRALGAGLGCITHAPGPVLFVVALLAIAHQLLSTKGFRIALLAVGWGLPIVLFWGFIIGNSSRHNLSALPPVALVIAAFIVHSTDSGLRAAVLALLIGVANYFSDREGEGSGFGTLVPRTDVLNLMPSVAERSKEAQAWARGFSRIKGDKVGLVARWSQPFAVYEVFRANEDAKSISYDGRDILVTRTDGTLLTVKTVYAVNPSQGGAAQKEMRDAGFTVWRRDF